MKKLMKPEIEFTRFDAQDVITTSLESKVLGSTGWDATKAEKDEKNGQSLTRNYNRLGWNDSPIQ